MQIDLSEEFDVICSECGTVLNGVHSDPRPRIHVDPCPTCIDEAQDSGYEHGYQDGKKDQ